MLQVTASQIQYLKAELGESKSKYCLFSLFLECSACAFNKWDFSAFKLVLQISHCSPNPISRTAAINAPISFYISFLFLPYKTIQQFLFMITKDQTRDQQTPVITDSDLSVCSDAPWHFVFHPFSSIRSCSRIKLLWNLKYSSEVKDGENYYIFIYIYTHTYMQFLTGADPSKALQNCSCAFLSHQLDCFSLTEYFKKYPGRHKHTRASPTIPDAHF